MTWNDVLKKELYVAVYAQTARFRIVKYILLFVIFGSIYWWKGWDVVLWTLGVAFVFAIAMHFFFRWKSKGWDEPWGPYKPPSGMPK